MLYRKPVITALVAARKDSKYLAKFLSAYMVLTGDFDYTPLGVMLSSQDTWNEELVTMFRRIAQRTPDINISFSFEDRRLGRAGLHLYYETLLNGQLPEWTIYFCEDHYLRTPNWDIIVRTEIEKRKLDPDEVWVIVPGWDNPGIGAMNHILSRGYMRALDGHIARHGNLDSYINHVIEKLPADRIIHLPDIFHDFTHDVPSMMDDSRTKVELGPEAATIPPWDSDEMRALIAADAEILNKAIGKGQDNEL